jgi:hypothetical protein
MPTLEYVRQRGLDGASFRSPENVTPTLDEGALHAARACLAAGCRELW